MNASLRGPPILVFILLPIGLIIAPNAVPANAGSWVNSVSLALGATWQPTQSLALDAGYAPTLTRYARFNSENHDDHRFTAVLARQERRLEL